MAGDAQRLQVAEFVTTPIHEGNDVVQLPEGAARLVAQGTQLAMRTTSTQAAPQRVGIQATTRAEATVPLSNPPTRLSGIALVVLIHAGRVPAASPVRLPLAGTALVEDPLAAPATRAPLGIAEGNAGTSIERQPLVSFEPGRGTASFP